VSRRCGAAPYNAGVFPVPARSARRLLCRAVAVSMLPTILAGCAAGPASAPPAGALEARVVHVDTFGGFAIVEWPGGRTFVGMGARELETYRPGDTIFLDSALRPVRSR
jgi:hypothetical protein